MNRTVKITSGFTIVELLIVIVIIGILAAITIVAYNGIQQRTSNTVTTNAVSEYAKDLQLYATNNGSYPTSGGSYSCFGAPGTICGNVTNTSAPCFGVVQFTTVAAFTAQMQTIISSSPQPSSQQVSCGGVNYGGALYDPGSLRIIWFLGGNQDCSGAAGLTGVNALYTGNATRCLGYLPSPS